MKVIVYASTRSKMIQCEKVIERSDFGTNIEFTNPCCKYEINNEDEFEIRELVNYFIIKFLYNLLIIIGLILGGGENTTYELMMILGEAYKKNKRVALFELMPLFRSRGRIKIKPIKCNDDTVITLFLLKSKIPFMVEVENGEIEILEHKRGFKK